MDSIKVAIKVRPLIKREKEENLPIQWEVQKNWIAHIDQELKKRGDPIYFDHIFDVRETNIDIFNVVAKPIIEAAVKGINGTIFAYGQTSSGKTYTMMGESENPGVIPLAVDYIFDKITSTYDREFLLRVAFIEIYNEKVNDLLDKNGVDLKLKEEKSGQVVIACKEEVANCPEFVLSLMRKGLKNRRIGETNMNERSSRSHTIFRVTIESREPNSDGAVQVSQLNLVDLAGSERPKQSGATGDRFNEGRHINMSLSALSLVIMQLSELQENPNRFINFRDSKLTRILQSSLGGNAMTTIICAVTPAAFEETQNTLAFASRAKRVKNKPQVNEVVSEATLLKRYAKQLAKLKDELEKATSADLVEEMESKLMEKESKLIEKESKLIEKDKEYQLLEERIKLLQTRIISGCSQSEEEKPNQRMRRRRTWGGAGTFKSSMGSIDLPTIKEVEKSPEKKKIDPEHKKKRQSIIETLDICNQTFQTAFTDFELELIESERARNRLSDSSLPNNDEDLRYRITSRPKRNVKFVDDVTVMDDESKSSETTPEKKPPEPSSPETPRAVLRSRINFLMEQYSDLNNDHKKLEEFTSLEKQMFVEEAVEAALVEHNKNMEELRKALASSEQSRQELFEKFTKLQNRSSKSDEQLEGLQGDLAETMKSLKAAQNEKDKILEELNTLKASKESSQPQMDVSVDKESSSIFANNTYLEEMDVSDSQCDSLIITDSENTENLIIRATSLLQKNTTGISNDSKKSKNVDNSVYSESLKQISEKTTDELSRVMQDLLSAKISLEEENAKLQATLQQKIREADDVKNDIRELKSGIEKLQETIQILTSENTELTTKLTIERESAKESEKSFQATIAELNSSIQTIAIEKPPKELDDTLTPTSDDEIPNVIEDYKKTIAALTAENEELSTNLMNQIEELDRQKELRVQSGDHECEYRRLLNDLTERNKLLESENVELSTDLMEKIEEYESLKQRYDNVNSKLLSTSINEKTNCLINFSMNRSHALKNETSPNTKSTNMNGEEIGETEENGIIESPVSHHTVDDLLRFSLPRADSTPVKSNGEVNDFSRKSITFKETSDQSNGVENETVESWKLKSEMLQAQVEGLSLLNKKLSDLKMTSCKQCAHLVELRDNRKLLRSEIKTLNRTLEDLQTKFDREFADTKILRTKASEELNLSICDASFNSSMNFDGINVSYVEEKVQILHDEVESLRSKQDKLTNLYREKCEEIEKLQDSNLRESVSPTSGTESPRLRRDDPKLDDLNTKLENLQRDLRHLQKRTAEINSALRKSDIERTNMQAEIESLKSEKEEFERKLKESEDLFSVKEKYDSLQEEHKIVKEQFENEKSSQNSEIESLRIEKRDLENKVAIENEELSRAREKITSLEAEVSRLNSEITRHEALTEEAENAKRSLEANVKFLENEKESLVEKIQEIESSLATKDKIDSLVNEVSRMSEEMKSYENVKNELENENALLKTEITRKNEKIESLKEEVARCVTEIENFHIVRIQLEEAKSSIETELDILRTEKDNSKDISNHIEKLSSSEEKTQSLVDEINRLRAEIQESNSKMQELEDAKSWLENKVQSLKTENEAYEEKSLTSENSSVEEKIKMLEDEMSSLVTKLENANVEQRQLEEAKAALQEKLDVIQIEKTIHADVLKQQQRSLKALDEENSQLKEKLAQLENLDDNSYQQKIEMLEGTLKTYERDLKNNARVIVDLREHLQEAEAAEKELIAIKLNLEEQIGFLINEKTTLKRQQEVTSDHLKQSNSENSSLIKRIETLECKLQVTLNDVNALTNEKVDLETKIQDHENLHQKILEENSRLVSEITHLQQGMNNLGESLRKLEDESQSHPKYEKAIMDENSNDAEKSYGTFKEYEKMVEELQGKLQEVTDELKSNTKESSLMNEELSKLKAVKEELNGIKLSLETKVEELSTEKRELCETITNLRIAVSEMEEKNSKLNEELEVLKTEEKNLNSKDSVDNFDRGGYEKKIEELSSRLQKVNKDLENYSKENDEYREQIVKLKNALDSNKNTEIESEKIISPKSYDENLRELESARKFIKKEIMSLKSSSENFELSNKSTSELFAYFVTTIMSKEKEVIKALSDNFEKEKRKLEEMKEQSLDVEKRASAWAKELELEVEKTQQDLASQETRNKQLSEKIQILENSLRESNHENQMLKDKMQVLEADFESMDVDKSSSRHQNSTLNATQDKERFVQDSAETREMELRSKLRLVEKQYKEKLDELTSNLEYQKTRNIDLTNNLEGLEANEKQLKSIIDLRTNELTRSNATIERIEKELNAMRESYNQASHDNVQKTTKIEEITSLLKNKCDNLSEYKTKLETITPEYEKLKEQANERQLKLERYRSEIECLRGENEKNISELKDRLASEEIQSASYRKQLTELTNRNTSLQMVIVELRTKCDELEITNDRMAKSMRNSTCKMRAEEEMDELREHYRTLERNLDGAGNRINELQDAKTRLMKDLSDLRVQYESVCAENVEMRKALSLHGPTSIDTAELRDRYENLLQEKNRLELELMDKRSRFEQMEKKIEAMKSDNENLKSKNGELDTEMDDIVNKIRELTDENSALENKLYATQDSIESYESKVRELRMINEDLEARLKNYLEEIEEFKSQRNNSGRNAKSEEGFNESISASKFVCDRMDSFSGDSDRCSSPNIESIRVDSRRRRSRNDLFNLNRPLEVFENNEHSQNCRCEAFKVHYSQLEKELVLKNAKIATLELKIQSEIFPHVRKCKDLEEILASMKKKNKAQEVQIRKLEEMRLKEMSSECERCKQWRNNKRDQASQCMPDSKPIFMSGTSSGVIEDHINVQKIAKLEKTATFLKNLCRTRQESIKELSRRIKELENGSSEKINDKSRDSATRNSSSKTDSSNISRQAMKENVPVIWSNQRQSSFLRRDPSWLS